MTRAAIAACVLLLLAAACGGAQTKAPDAASLVPASASSYLRVRTSELERAKALLPRFPARGSGLQDLPRVPLGAGRELDVATLAGGRIFYTQPADVRTFEKQLDATGRVHAAIRGWVVFAASPALLATVKHRRGDLATEGWYTAAAATLPANAVLRELTRGWRAIGLTVHAHDAELDVHRLRPPLPQTRSALAGLVPADAIAAAGTAGPLTVPDGAPTLLHELATALDGPVVGWVRPGGELPEVTVVAEPAHGRRALRETNAFLATLTRNPATAEVSVDGLSLRAVVTGPVTFYFGLVDGRLVVSTDAGAAARTRLHGTSLPAASQLPGATESWGYVDVPSDLPLARRFAGLLDARISKSLQARLAPLSALFVYATHQGAIATTVTQIDLRPRP